MFKSFNLRTKFTALFYTITLSVMLIVGWFGFSSTKTAYINAARDLATSYTHEICSDIQNLLYLLHNDLDFIVNNYAVQRHFYWGDIGEQEKSEQYHQIVADMLRGFAISYAYNYKIRIIESDGLENIKVIRDPLTGTTQVSTDKELEDQGEKDFFKQTMRLPRGYVFASEMALNQEKGQIMKPYLPTVHFSTPLIGSNNVRYGIVVTNVLADKFFDYIRAANNNRQGRVFYLIAPNGDYLFHPNAEKQFGSQLGHHANFESDFNGLLEQMRSHQMGSLIAHNAIIAYQTIYPNPFDKKNYWLLVGVVPESIALAELFHFEMAFAGLLLLVIVSVFFISRYFLARLFTPLEFVTYQLQSLGRGEISTQSLAYTGQDELRAMLDSTQILLGNMEQQARQADAIGQGDFSVQVNVLSEQDRLGFALNNMVCMLRNSKQDEQNRNWLRDGLEQLSKALTGNLSTAQLADTAISLLGRYLEAGRGVFFLYDAENQVLDLLGSYMYTERQQVGGRFKLGEGAVGQVAREKKPIFLTAITEDLPLIVTGTCSGAPLYIYTYPLLRNDTVLGAIELASFNAFDSLKRQFLQEAIQTIAAFLYMALQQEQIKTLLQISETAEQEARAKSVRLEQANSLMAQQQQTLQQQTEELQQTNAQMEVQQTQLQQQTEELQQINAQLEEQQQQLQQQSEELQQTNAQMEEAQQQLEQQNRQLLESQQEIDTRAQQLELASRYKSEFLANMSHELRTPLNSIILLSKMLAANSEKHLSNEEARHAEIIHSAGEELLRLINDVLDLSKIEAGRMELNLVTIDSQSLLNDLNELFEHAAKQKTLRFTVEDKFHGQFVSDLNRLSQILRNLLSNAFKFTESGGVTLTIEQVQHAQFPLRISVKDTGIGIPDEKRKLIFEAFQQVDGSISRQYGGTGLGLSISLRFAQLLGGTIELTSQVGQGSEFALLLPLAISTPAAPVALPTAAPKSVAANTALPLLEIHDDRARISANDAVILLIDDDPLFGQALLEINRKQEYKTLLAMTGRDGLALAQQYQPHGILLDLGLPDMDGRAVLHELKTRHELAQIPVYIVSAREKDAALSQEGFLGYLQKPVDAAQISQAETALLSAIRQTAAQTVLLIENGTANADMVRQMLEHQAATLIAAQPDSDFQALLHDPSCCLAIIDLDDSVAQALDIAQRLRELNAHLNFVFLGSQPLSDEETAQLYPYSDCVIIKTPQSERRLLENIQRFLTKAARHPATSPSEAKGHAKRLTGRRILVVDDDARNLFVITAALEKEGANVNGVLNGKRALEFLKQNRADMIFMDIMMPEMDGYQTIKQIRQNPALAKTPVVVLTAKALASDREQALAAGADDYLSKPADYDVLIQMASVWCAGRH